MNTKKLLSALLVSLGAFTLVLTGCGEKPTPNPTDEPTSDTSVAPTDEPTTVEPTSDEQPTPSEPDTPTPSEPDTPTPSEPDTPTPTEPDTPTPTDPEPPTDPVTDPGDIPPEATLYDVTFNYDEATENLTVWTDYAIDGTIAPNATNVSEQEGIEERHTVPLATGGLDCGIYFFAVDANGYIVYASYGLGVGYGAPGDGYYHNQAFKDVYDAQNWSIHDEWAAWPNKTEDGRNAWTLYDFIIPEGGFVVRGHADEANMKEFWKQITGQFSVPKSTNTTLEGSTQPGALNNFYLSINEDHQLEVRERTEAETIVDGVQEEETPSQRFTPTDADQPFEYFKVEAVNALEDNATVADVRGVITHMNGANVTIQDEDGNAILLYDNQLKEGYAVGDTIVLSGTKTTYNGHPEIKSLTSLTKIEKYGRLPAVAAREVTAENVAEAWVIENNYGLFKLVKAQVLELGQNAKVQLGDVEITLFKVHMPETVAVGDYVDVVCSMQAYNDQVQGRTASTADVSRYYSVTVDVDGVDGSVEPAVSVHASGASVTMTAKHEDPNYSFSHWEKLVGETWEQVSTEPTHTITVGEVDEQYRAVFNYAAWALLPGTYAEALVETPDKVNGDAGGDAFAVLTEGVLHTEGAWTSGAFNTSWRTIIVVDKDGKVAYAVSNPANGYGGPSGSGYYAHPDYADYTLNPAFNILEGYGPWTQEAPDASKKFEIVVPEGGFILTAHGTDGELLWTTLGAEAGAGDAGHNNREALDHSARVFYDEANNALRVFVDDSKPEADFQGLLNSVSADLPSVYDHRAENPALGDLTLAFDAQGKIMFASRTSSGYGGPADGFYHDGTYSWTAGQQCGIFLLQDTFAAWEQGKDNHTHYSVVIPEGWLVVTGTEAQMKPLLAAVDSNFAAGGNYFEGVADGIFNDTRILRADVGQKVVGIDLEKVTFAGMKWGGATTGDFVYNEEIGFYTATIALNQWNKVSFTYTDADGVEKVLNYENTRLNGLFTAADVNGADWTANLYHEVGEDGVDSAVNGIFYTCTGGTYYAFYDVENNRLTVTDVNEAPSFAQVGTSLTWGGTNNGEIAWDAKAGAYKGTVTLATWNNIIFTYTDAEGATVVLNYDTANLVGAFIAKDGNGADWTPNLYHEDGSWAEGKFYTCTGGDYAVTYDPVSNTLTVKAA